MPRCKACGAPVRWAGRMPYDPDGRGHVCLGRILRGRPWRALVRKDLERKTKEGELDLG